MAYVSPKKSHKMKGRWKAKTTARDAFFPDDKRMADKTQLHTSMENIQNLTCASYSYWKKNKKNQTLFRNVA